MTPRPVLPRPALVLVTDSARRPGGVDWMVDVVRQAALGGVNVVQLREKHLSRGHLIDVGLRVRDAIEDRALLFVNGDVEAAVALGAEGVHLPQDGPRIADVRAMVGDKMLISRAVHDVDGAERAIHEGADLLQIGTVFATASKPEAVPIGLDGVRAAVEEARTAPVIAIGGITPANAGDVMRAGAAGVAVIGAIFDADDPHAAAVALCAAIGAPSRA